MPAIDPPLQHDMSALFADRDAGHGAPRPPERAATAIEVRQAFRPVDPNKVWKGFESPPKPLRETPAFRPGYSLRNRPEGRGYNRSQFQMKCSYYG